MKYLCAFYEPDYPEHLKVLAETFYGKYRCGGPITLVVFELQQDDQLAETKLLWKVPYNQQKYVYVKTFYDRSEDSLCKELLKNLAAQDHVYDEGSCVIILSDCQITQLGAYLMLDESLWSHDKELDADEIGGYIEEAIFCYFVLK